MPVLVLFLSSCLWGLTWLPLKYLHQRGAEGVLLITVAYGVLALVCLPWLWRQRRSWRPAPMVLVALLGGFANLAFSVALMYGDVVRVMVLFYLLPIWSALGGRLFLHEVLDRRRLISVGLALVGAFVILEGWNLPATPLSWIDGLALGAGFAFAMNNIVFRATPSLPLVSKIGVMVAGCSLAGGLILALGLQPLPVLDAATWAGVMAMGLVWYLLATFCSQWAVTQLEAGQVGVILVMELIAAVVSAVVLGESVLTGLKLAGVICVLTASLLESWRPRHPVAVNVPL